MQKEQRSRRRLFIAVGTVMAGMLLASCNQCGSPPPNRQSRVNENRTPPSNTNNSSANGNETANRNETSEESSARIRRYLANVYAGDDADSLSQLSDDAWHGLRDRDRVNTDVNGEGWLRISDCMQVYVFQSSGLMKAPCPKSAYLAGNVTCSLRGTSVFNNKCGSRVIIQTDSAQIVLEGTWISVTYLPDQLLTVIIVFDGLARVQAVQNFTERTLGEPVAVAAKQFWFSAPDGRVVSIRGLTPRQPHPFDELPTLIEQLKLSPWVARISERAKSDKIEFPDLTPGKADLVVDKLEKVGDASLNPRGLLEVPLSVIVRNQGNASSAVFKTAIMYTGPLGSSVVAFTVPEQKDQYYPFTRGPVAAGESVTFQGKATIQMQPRDLARLKGRGSLPVSFQAIVDSCAGDELSNKYCRVEESNEDNNESAALPVSITMPNPGTKTTLNPRDNIKVIPNPRDNVRATPNPRAVKPKQP